MNRICQKFSMMLIAEAEGDEVDEIGVEVVAGVGEERGRRRGRRAASRSRSGAPSGRVRRSSACQRRGRGSRSPGATSAARRGPRASAARCAPRAASSRARRRPRREGAAPARGPGPRARTRPGLPVGALRLDARDAGQRRRAGPRPVRRPVDAHREAGRRPRAAARGLRACPRPAAGRASGSGCGEQSALASERMCVESRTVRPASPRRSPRISTVWTGSRPTVGSSSTRSWRVPDQRLREADALPVALRELAGQRSGHLRQPAALDDVVDRRAPRAAAQRPSRSATKARKRLHGELGVQAHLLREVADLPPGRERPVGHVDRRRSGPGPRSARGSR